MITKRIIIVKNEVCLNATAGMRRRGVALFARHARREVTHRAVCRQAVSEYIILERGTIVFEVTGSFETVSTFVRGAHVVAVSRS